MDESRSGAVASVADVAQSIQRHRRRHDPAHDRSRSGRLGSGATGSIALALERNGANQVEGQADSEAEAGGQDQVDAGS